jgi:hypothetical protein
MWHDEQLPGAMVERLWEDPERLMASGAMLKDGDRCTVVRLGGSSGRRGKTGEVGAQGALVLKRYNQRDWLHTAVHAVMRSRARWCWANGKVLLDGGLLTPTPLACVDERRHGVLRMRSYLLTEFAAGDSLTEFVEANESKADALRAIADEFTGIWRRLGQLRIGYGDMKASNFIVDRQKRLWLIDLDGMRVYRTGPWFRRERRNDLASFMRNWQAKPGVAEVFRLRLGLGG